MLLSCAACHAASQAKSQIELPYHVADYPLLAQRIAFFQQRLLSGDDRIRYDLMMLEVANQLPLPESEKLVRTMMKDPYPEIREQATRQLLSHGYQIAPADVPPLFANVDRSNQEALAATVARLRTGIQAKVPPDYSRGGQWDPKVVGDADPGYSAQMLGLFGDESDLPRLKPLLNHPNVFVRFSAANATISLGDPKTGRAALSAIGYSPIEDPGNLFYIENALLALHRLGDSKALQRLISHLRALENTQEINARFHRVYVLKALANLTNIWNDNAQTWQQWLDEKASA